MHHTNIRKYLYKGLLLITFNQYTFVHIYIQYTIYIIMFHVSLEVSRVPNTLSGNY